MASSKYGKCSRMEVGRYVPIIGSRLMPATTSQLTTFGPCQHIDSMLLNWGWSQTNRPTPPCALPDDVVITHKHKMLYPNLFQK